MTAAATHAPSQRLAIQLRIQHGTRHDGWLLQAIMTGRVSPALPWVEGGLPSLVSPLMPVSKIQHANTRL